MFKICVQKHTDKSNERFIACVDNVIDFYVGYEQGIPEEVIKSKPKFNIFEGFLSKEIVGRKKNIGFILIAIRSMETNKHESVICSKYYGLPISSNVTVSEINDDVERVHFEHTGQKS